MGAMKDLALRFCYVCYPVRTIEVEEGIEVDRAIDRMLEAMRNPPGPVMQNPTPAKVREYIETNNRWPTLDTEEIIRMVEQNEQPDPVCVCGKTSEGTCPRCGQKMPQ